MRKIAFKNTIKVRYFDDHGNDDVYEMISLKTGRGSRTAGGLFVCRCRPCRSLCDSFEYDDRIVEGRPIHSSISKQHKMPSRRVETEGFCGLPIRHREHGEEECGCGMVVCAQEFCRSYHNDFVCLMTERERYNATQRKRLAKIADLERKIAALEVQSRPVPTEPIRSSLAEPTRSSHSGHRVVCFYSHHSYRSHDWEYCPRCDKKICSGRCELQHCC